MLSSLVYNIIFIICITKAKFKYFFISTFILILIFPLNLFFLFFFVSYILIIYFPINNFTEDRFLFLDRLIQRFNLDNY